MNNIKYDKKIKNEMQNLNLNYNKLLFKNTIEEKILFCFYIQCGNKTYKCDTWLKARITEDNFILEKYIKDRHKNELNFLLILQIL